MNKENGNLVNLDDSELDNIVGGAFNQSVIEQYELAGRVFRKKTSVPFQQSRFEIS